MRAGAAAFRLFNGAVPPTLSIRDQVAVTVAERIVQQTLPPGTRIREQLLADEFGISKAPVGEALSLLEHAGLVESSAHRSSFVTRISAQDFAELMEFRFALGRALLPRYALANTEEDQQVMQRYVDQMTAILPSDAQAFEFAELGDRSVLFVATRAGSGRLARAMYSLSLQLLRYFAMTTRTVVERRQILDRAIQMGAVLAARNPERALDLFDQHAQLRGTDVLAHLRDLA